MPKNRLPSFIPPGWIRIKLPKGVAIVYVTPTGLRCMFSIDPGPNGKWERHLSMSREERYPGWDEMKEMVYGAGVFDPNKPVTMILPPRNKPDQYVNLQPNTFHWWQPE